jgi:hypothetical protein
VTQSKYELKAVEYRVRAEAATAAAGTCDLERARQQHELAAARWTELAEAEERRALEVRARLDSAPARRAAPTPEDAL